MIPENYKPIMIEFIIKLVKEHRKSGNCDSTCTISCFMLGFLVKELQGKELNCEQQKLFL